MEVIPGCIKQKRIETENESKKKYIYKAVIYKFKKIYNIYIFYILKINVLLVLNWQ